MRQIIEHLQQPWLRVLGGMFVAGMDCGAHHKTQARHEVGLVAVRWAARVIQVGGDQPPPACRTAA